MSQSTNNCTYGKKETLKDVDEALSFLLDQVKPISDVEILPLEGALGRVLAEPAISPVDVPPWPNSAMDGYAFKYTDIVPNLRYKVSQYIPAGASGQSLENGTLARIFTGAPVPHGADTVVMQEACDVDADAISILKLPDKGANIRDRGEDVRKGETVLKDGIRLDPQHLGLAASLGVATLKVYRRPRVAFFSSGDELVMPGKQLGQGQIYNSNHFSLHGLLQRLGCEVIQLGTVEDTLDATRDALAQAAADADLILASGGVSVGDKDHVKPAVEQLGQLDLWKIAIRPGKPLAFGHVNQVPFIGAPGNPVSLFVTFCIFARPFIKKLQGIKGDLSTKPIQAIANFDWLQPDKRREYARAQVTSNNNGQLVMSLHPSRSSGVLSSITWANGLAVIEKNQIVHQGDSVSFLSFNELLS